MQLSERLRQSLELNNGIPRKIFSLIQLNDISFNQSSSKLRLNITLFILEYLSINCMLKITYLSSISDSTSKFTKKIGEMRFGFLALVFVSDFFFWGSSVSGSTPIEPPRDPVSRTVEAKRPSNFTLRSIVMLEKSA